MDLLIFHNNTLYPIEVKQHSAPTSRDIKSFDMLDRVKGTKRGEGGIVCLSQELLPLKDNHRIIPLCFL